MMLRPTAAKKTRGAWVPVLLNRPDFSVAMKRRILPLSKEHYYAIW